MSRTGGFDAGIRSGKSVERDMVAVPVGLKLRTVAVGTLAYFAHRPVPTTPAALESRVCVNYRPLGGGGLLPCEFEDAGPDIRVKVLGQLIVNDEVLAAAAVRAGAGLGYMMGHDVSDEIAERRLIQALADLCPAYPGCHLYYPDRGVMPAVRALIHAFRL